MKPTTTYPIRVYGGPFDGALIHKRRGDDSPDPWEGAEMEYRPDDPAFADFRALYLFDGKVWRHVKSWREAGPQVDANSPFGGGV